MFIKKSLRFLFAIFLSNVSNACEEVESKASKPLKVMTLNIWGGHEKEPLLEFLANNEDVDVFCFQEVYQGALHKISTDDQPVSLDILSEIQKKLPKHKSYFRPVVQGIYGIAMLVKEGIEVIEEGEYIIYDNPNYSGSGPTHKRILQSLYFKVGDERYTVINVHGLWNGKGKTDTPERILQSQKICDFLQTVKTPYVLLGDFNLRPDTESLALLAQNRKNLIAEFGITSTRTPLYPKEEKYADYVFTSKDLEVCKFEVRKDVVSDHAPLIVECKKIEEPI